MNRSTTRRRIGMATAALLLGATIGFSGPSASAVVTRSTFTPFTPGGRLEIAWAGSSTSATVTHVNAAGAVVTTIPITVNSKCEVTNLAQLSELVTFTTSNRAGISVYDNGIGITASNSNCTPANGRVTRGLSLTVGLGSRFTGASGTYAGQLLVGGTADIEGKYSAGLRYSTDGGTTTRSVALTASSDNGSDSSSNDNTRVPLTSTSTNVGFSSIRFEATGNRQQAAIALDTGGDWADKAANKTILTLGTPGTTYEYTVNCGEFATADSTDNQSDGAQPADSTVAGVEFFRLANKNQATCAPIGVSIQATNGISAGNDDDVIVDNSTTSADGTTQNVRARVRITWIVETSGKSPAAVELELAREIDYTPGDAAGVHPVQWCTSVPAAVAANPLTALDVIGHPAGEPWCLLSDTRIVSGTRIIQTQIYSGNGDPQWR